MSTPYTRAAPKPTAMPSSSNSRLWLRARRWSRSQPKRPRKPVSAAWASRRTLRRWRSSWSRRPPVTSRARRSRSTAAAPRGFSDCQRFALASPAYADDATDFRRSRTPGMRFVQVSQARKPVVGPGGAAPRCHVDADRDRFGGSCQPALARVKHAHEVMYALRVEGDQLKGEIQRIALAQLVLIGDMRFQRERAATGRFDARSTEAEHVPGEIESLVEEHGVVADVHVAVRIDVLRQYDKAGIANAIDGLRDVGRGQCGVLPESWVYTPGSRLAKMCGPISETRRAPT